MKKLIRVLACFMCLICLVVCVGCDKDPADVKGEEVSSVEWYSAFTSISNAFCLKDPTASMTVSGSMQGEGENIDFTVKLNDCKVYLEVKNGDDTFIEYGEIEENNTKYYFFNGEKWIVKNYDLTEIIDEFLTEETDDLKSEYKKFKFNEETNLYEGIVEETSVFAKFSDKKVIYMKLAGYYSGEFKVTDIDKTVVEKPDIQL